MSNYLAFDIGGTEIKYGLLTESGDILEKGRFPTVRNNGEAILQAILTKVSIFPSLRGIAISAPGFVNNQTGFIEMGGAIKDFDGFNIKTYMEELTNLPVTVENDVNCVALAEKWKGNAQDIEHFICMTVGTGVGGAVFLNNQLYRGISFGAGEFGFMITHGTKNDSAFKNTLSWNGSISGMRERYAKYKGILAADVTGEDVFQAYETRDPIALEEVERFYDSLAIGMHNLYFMFNPSKILIGGAVSAREGLIPELRRRVESLNGYINGSCIESCHLNNDAGMMGALFHHLQTYVQQGRRE
ncbi:ROK family protein [Peribacillus sp. NJ11]|uniref:ROK family protein n=1 Tax=Peribacillus sp. NJ11 TaxID=3055861 RepID=UPI0025A2D133|nr:ROK family protein [Peribacillus sp. NJ11]MDM5222863.1 ROK family protein [Peribacillus sp. NJ11]